MTQIKAYHRPKTITQTLELINKPKLNTVIIAGGTHINAHMPPDVEEVVDLQAIGLDTIDHTQNYLTLGSMVRLQSIVDYENTPPLLKEMTHREGPNTLRNAATVGGVVVGADWESELIAALLVYQASVIIKTLNDSKTISLADFLSNPTTALQGGLLTAISLNPTGQTASERVARTPKDHPIVAAVGRLDDSEQLYLALCGVASTPILVDSNNPTNGLTPPADFRGSSNYRQQMASTLSQRVIQMLQNQNIQS